MPLCSTRQTYAADVYKFDSRTLDLIDDDPRETGSQVIRYGVEVLGGSGTRGNINEFVCGLSLGLFGTETWVNEKLSFFVSQLFRMGNPHFRYFDGSAHGYAVLRITSDQVESEFWQFPILTINDDALLAKTMVVKEGVNFWDEE